MKQEECSNSPALRNRCRAPSSTSMRCAFAALVYPMTPLKETGFSNIADSWNRVSLCRDSSYSSQVLVTALPLPVCRQAHDQKPHRGPARSLPLKQAYPALAMAAPGSRLYLRRQRLCIRSRQHRCPDNIAIFPAIQLPPCCLYHLKQAASKAASSQAES